MKRHIKFILLTVFAISVLGFLMAQPTIDPDPAYKKVYQNPKIQEAIEFMKFELPNLVKTDPVFAAAEYEKHFSNLNQLEEWDVLYLVGHFYAVADDASTALRYFLELAKHPQLGEDARRMINILLYQRAVENLLKSDKETTRLFLQDIINIFDTEKYYPVYLFMWADLMSVGDDAGLIEDYIANYKANQNWIENRFKPGESAILGRLEQLNTDEYFKNPTQTGYQILANAIDSIKADLNTLYSEARTVKGLAIMDTFNQVQREENILLEEYKRYLYQSLEIKGFTVDKILASDSTLIKEKQLEEYREPAQYIAQARTYQALLARTISLMDEIFETRYNQFITEDPSVMGRDFSDMEMKRLIDIEKNIRLYDVLIQTYQEAMNTPEYKAQTAVSFSDQLKLYQDKKQDLQIRKDRYLALRKHGAETEEAYFNEFYEEYLEMQGLYDEFALIVDGYEEAFLATFMMRYPQEMKQLAQGKIDELKTQQPLAKINDQLNMIEANLDFIALQNRYRQIHYQDAVRQADASLSLDAKTQEYGRILAEKQTLLDDYKTFAERNPDFKAFLTPVEMVPREEAPEYDGRYDYLISPADVYYNMAELQWAIELDQPAKALNYYYLALEKDPDFYLRDYALYNAAFIKAELNLEKKEGEIENFRLLNPNKQRGSAQRISESDFTEAIANYRTIIEDYPTSTLRDEAIYRLANLYFIVGTDAERPIEWYTQAIDLFDMLAADQNSKYRYEAMFQRGYVNLNISDENSLNSALVDFASIMKAADSNLITPADTAQDLKYNSLDQIAYCLVALDGTDFVGESRGLGALASVLGEVKDESILNRILDKASENKKDLRANRQSIDFLELRLQKMPLALSNPSLVDSILVLYYATDTILRPGENLTQIRRDWYRFIVDQYGSEGAWYDANIKDKELSNPELVKQLASIRNAYRQAQIVLYDNVTTQLSEDAFQAYLAHTARFEAFEQLFQPAVYTAYVDYLDKYFKVRPAAYDANLAAWKLNFAKEEVTLIGVMADRQNTPEAFMRVYNALLAYNEKYLTLADADYYVNERQAYSYAMDRNSMLKPMLSGAEADELHAFFKEATFRFTNAMMNQGTEESIRLARQITLDLANTEYMDNRYQDAEARYLSILETDPSLTNNAKYDIYYNLSWIAQDDPSLPAYERYKKAENYARKAMEYTSDGAKIAQATQMAQAQIANTFNVAIDGGDHSQAAISFGRLAEEFTFEKHPNEHLNYVKLQSEQYKLGKEYDKLIENYMYLASKEKASNLDAIYGFYYESWNVADSLMQDTARATAIKDEFMGRYPGSNYTYRLRAADLERKAANPDTKIAAAEAFIALSEEVRTGKIDAGDVKPENIYMQAYNIYNEDQSSSRRLEVLEEFVTRYPNNPDVTSILKTIASGYGILKDNAKYELYAKRLFDRDKKEYEPYLDVVKKRLNRILVEYDTAYLNKEWTLAFSKRDEFNAEVAKYKKEGLPLNTDDQTKAFADAKAEYDTIQARLASLKGFDDQLRGIENGDFFKKTPNQHVTVDAKTSFNSTLLGGKAKRLPSFATAVNAEIRKVERLLNNENLDSGRIVKALALEARIYERSAEIVTTQIEKYMDVSNEFKPFKNDADAQATIWGQMNANYIYPFEDAANELYVNLNSTFHMAGYVDANTRNAVAKLTERGILPEFEKVEYPLGPSWNISWKDENGGGKAVSTNFKTITTPRGQILGETQIPEKTTLAAEIQLNSMVAPSFVFVQMVFPYEWDSYVNGISTEPRGFAIDSLDVTQGITARYGYTLSGAAWDAKQNTINLSFPNKYQESIPVRLTLQAYYDKSQLEQARPRETITFSSNPSWKVMVVNPETAEENAISARLAQSFNVPQDMINGLADTKAQPVWVLETEEEPINNVTFETDLMLDGTLVYASIEFLAPELANIYLNGQLVAADQMMYADDDPPAIYTNIVDLPLDMLVTGKNTIRIEVQNQTAYRGMLAEIKIEKYAKE